MIWTDCVVDNAKRSWPGLMPVPPLFGRLALHPIVQWSLHHPEGFPVLVYLPSQRGKPLVKKESVLS